MSQMLLDIAPEWVPSLDNFVAGRNIELLSVLRETTSAQIIYLWGAAGGGKTHLLQAMVARARTEGRAAHYACGVVPEAVEVVAVDDVETLDDSAQIALFELYNRMREQGGLLLAKRGAGTGAPRVARRPAHPPRRGGWCIEVQCVERCGKGRCTAPTCRGAGLRIAAGGRDLSAASWPARLAQPAGAAGCAG